MAYVECSLVMVSAIRKGKRKGKKFPEVVAIVIAPTPEAARIYAEKEMEVFLPQNSLLEVKTLGQVLFLDAPTTIFLYVQPAGRIK